MSAEKTYWQSLDELAKGAERAAAEGGGEPAGGGTLWEILGDGPAGSRRDFLKAMGFGLAAASVAACSPIPERRAVPPLAEAAGATPGVASYYATTCGGCAASCGLLVKVRDGRPIKVEGNPDSPLTLGGTCAVGQATVLSLYDEGRLRGPLWLGKPTPWEEVDAAVAAGLDAAARRGAPIVLLTGPVSGPATRALLAEWRGRFPTARHVVHEAVSTAALRRASEESFGAAAVPHLRLDRARMIVALEADFLGTWLAPVELTRQYAASRRLEGSDGSAMARHVQIETGLSLSGSNADLRLPVHPSELGLAALALLAGVARRAEELVPELPAGPWEPALLDGVAADLWAHRGVSVVLSGADDVAIQRVVHRINSLLGNIGIGGIGGIGGSEGTVDLDRPLLQGEGDGAAVLALIEAMERGEVGALLLYGVNPAYDHPQGARFRRALARVPLAVSFADRADETAAHVHAVCPDHHFLEAWGDAEPVAGRLQLAQPTIAPLFSTRAAQESLLAWMGGAPDFHAYLREHWRREVFPRATLPGGGQRAAPTGFDEFWDRALEAGGVERKPAAAASPARSDRSDLAGPIAALLERYAAGRALRDAGNCELHLYEKVALRDGRWANNPWLQELPDPIAKATWGNWAALSPALAARLGVVDGDVVAVEGTDGRTARLELPALIQPGQAANAVSIALGYGRSAAGRVGDGVGVNAFPLLGPPGASGGWRVTRTGQRQELALTQTHASAEGRPIVHEESLAAYRGAAEPPEREPEDSLWAEPPREGHFWGMAIDLGACTGCAACVVACQAENNVPVVGPDEVRRGREMHWIRIDRYYSGEPEAPQTVHQPMMCQHCDNAPCETVCPVLATVHSSDGLNQQVYNRCVGTRYCANNCPYKVRRFNWFRYAENDRFPYNMASDLGRMVLNPDVVVRSRGVMEKCSMCIQRIQDGKLAATGAGRKLADGEIATACQQACPADAIVFGDGNDPASRLVRRRRDRRFYRVLEELNTRPGVGYLAKVRA